MSYLNDLKYKYSGFSIAEKIIFLNIILFVLPYFINTLLFLFNLNSKFVFKQSSWGLSFDWLPKGKTLFNIRSETVHEKSFSYSLIANNRCLVPFSSYFEWMKTQELKEKLMRLQGMTLRNLPNL